MALIGFNANDTQFMTYFRLIRENIPFGRPACFVQQLWSAAYDGGGSGNGKKY